MLDTGKKSTMSAEQLSLWLLAIGYAKFGGYQFIDDNYNPIITTQNSPVANLIYSMDVDLSFHKQKNWPTFLEVVESQ